MSEALPARGNLFGRFISARYLLAVLGSLGMAIVYGLKVNLSVAIITMLNHTALSFENSLLLVDKNEDTCDAAEVGDYADQHEDGPFTWPGTLQGTMLSSYFWGYILAQIPGGRIAELFSAKWVMFFAVAINIICTVLTPLAAKLHFGAMLLMRVLEGIGGGVTFPAMHVLLAHWSPPGERSVMISIVYAGTALGTVVSMISTGVLAGTLGWESVFYVMGSASGIWLVLWGLLIADTPDQQVYIDEDERLFLLDSLGKEMQNKSKKMRVPWKSVFTSPAFLAILIAHTCNNWGWYVVLIELPLYMKTIQKFHITSNSIITAVPFFLMWVYSLILSRTLDNLRSRKIIDTTCARKSATFISSFIPALCFMAMIYIGCMKYVAVILMTITVTVIGGMFSGFLSNHIDIAPNFAGTLMALTNTAATIPGIIVPLFVGELTQRDPSLRSWRIIFWTTIVLYLVEIFVYVMFASGEEQPWNREDYNDSIEAQPLNSPNVEPSGHYKSTREDEEFADESDTKIHEGNDIEEK